MKSVSRNLRMFNPISTTILILLLIGVGTLYYVQNLDLTLSIVLVVVSILISSSIHIADQ